MAGKHVGTDLYPNPDGPVIGIKAAIPGERINRAWAEGNDGTRVNSHVTGTPEDLAYLAGAAALSDQETAPARVGVFALTVPDAELLGPITEEPSGTPDVAWVTGFGLAPPVSVGGGELSLPDINDFAYADIQGPIMDEGTIVRVFWSGAGSSGLLTVTIAGGSQGAADAANGEAFFAVGPDLDNRLRFEPFTAPLLVAADVEVEILVP